MLDKARAEELADGLDLDRVTYCAACVFELAWAIHTGHAPHWQTVARVADWTWAELEESLFAALVDARMREVRFAEDGLRDLRERGHRTAVARAVVLRLAERMADDYTYIMRVMYAAMVRRLQIMIDEDLDEALARQARDEGTSKAALIRRYVRERVKPLPPIEEDPLWEIVGMVEGSPDDSLSVNDVVYGPKREK